VFDFDGTLVDTAAAKRCAFFGLFPRGAGYAEIVEAVLTDDPDGSRHAVIPRMAQKMAAQGLPLADAAVDARIALYGDRVVEAVAAAPEVDGAGALLAAAHRMMAVHIASATPAEPLRAEVARRGWLNHLDGVHGWPAGKAEVVRELMSTGGHAAAATLVVGDGVSDEAAARANGTAFHRIAAPADLRPVAALLGVEP
jgi:phosphoglycolate phosphatase-like HAD superfamily hydrolase